MAKSLALRVQEVARKIFHPQYIGFILGRFILDTFLSTWEDMEWARESRQQALFLKMDVYKAYDHIDWSFITSMLTCLG